MKMISSYFIIRFCLRKHDERARNFSRLSHHSIISCLNFFSARCGKGRALHHYYVEDGFRPPQHAAPSTNVEEAKCVCTGEYARVNLRKQIFLQSQMFILVVDKHGREKNVIELKSK